MALARSADVATLFRLVRSREMNDDEKIAVAQMLDWVEAEIAIQYPSLADWDESRQEQVKRVEVSSVMRVVRNPNALRQFSGSIDDGSESGTIDSVASSGELYITAEEWALLGRAAVPVGTVAAAGAFSIRPTYSPDTLVTRRQRASERDWERRWY